MACAKPITITHIPCGYIRRATEDGRYCIGDQAAVIPSFTGDGMLNEAAFRGGR